MKKYIISFLLSLICFGIFAADGSANLLHLDDKTFDEAGKGKVLIVDFYADWCGPCQKFAPVFAEVAAKLPEYTFAKVNVDYTPLLAARYEIQFIPYIVAIADGKIVAKYSERVRNEQTFTKWVKSIKK